MHDGKRGGDWGIGFKSCPREGGNTGAAFRQPKMLIKVSSHAPVKGATMHLMYFHYKYSSFKSCPREGGNVIAYLIGKLVKAFQVMPP